MLVSSEEFSDTIEEAILFRRFRLLAALHSKGSSIAVVVSKGSKMRTLPYVDGLTLVAAADRLPMPGWWPVQEEQYSDTVAAGSVIGYRDYQSGQTLEAGSSVTILVSRGKEPGPIPTKTGKKRREEKLPSVFKIFRISSRQNQASILMDAESPYGFQHFAPDCIKTWQTMDIAQISIPVSNKELPLEKGPLAFLTVAAAKQAALVRLLSAPRWNRPCWVVVGAANILVDFWD